SVRAESACSDRSACSGIVSRPSPTASLSNEMTRSRSASDARRSCGPGLGCTPRRYLPARSRPTTPEELTTSIHPAALPGQAGRRETPAPSTWEWGPGRRTTMNASPGLPRGCAPMPEFSYTDLLPLGPDATEYRQLSAAGVAKRAALGREFIEV